MPTGEDCAGSYTLSTTELDCSGAEDDADAEAEADALPLPPLVSFEFLPPILDECGARKWESAVNELNARDE
jgi:hypothetical protein